LANRGQKQQAERLLLEAMRAKEEIVRALDTLMNIVRGQQKDVMRKAA
jgi:hypothetical protein